MIAGPLKEQLDGAGPENQILGGTSASIRPVLPRRPPDWLWLFFVVLVTFVTDKKQLKGRKISLCSQVAHYKVDKHGGGIMGHLLTWSWPSRNRVFWLELGLNYDP